MDRSFKIMRRLRISVVILNRTFLMLRALSFSSMMILMSCLVLVFIKVVGDGASSVYSASLRGLSASIGGRNCVFLLCNGILGILVLRSSSSVPSSGEEDCDHDHDRDVIQKLLASNAKGDPEVTLLLGRSGAGEEPKNNKTEIQKGEDAANATTPHVFVSEYKNTCSQFDHPVTGAIEEEGGAAAQRVCHCKIRHLLDGASQQQDNKVHPLLFLDPNLFHIELSYSSSSYLISPPKNHPEYDRKSRSVSPFLLDHTQCKARELHSQYFQRSCHDRDQ